MIFKRKNSEEMLRNEWFCQHQATLETAPLQDGRSSITVLDWSRPDSSMYAVRYVFSGSTLFVTGDLGSAVFKLTERAALSSLAHYSISYFHEKLACCDSDDMGVDFDADSACASIKSTLSEQLEGEEESDAELEDLITRLCAAAEGCQTKTGWSHELVRFYDELSSFDSDWYEWLPCCGDTYSHRLQAYLIGLQMADAQLNATHKEQKRAAG